MLGTQAYKDYMTDFVKAHPHQMPSRMKQVPQVDTNKIKKTPTMPDLAAHVSSINAAMSVSPDMRGAAGPGRQTRWRVSAHGR